MLVYGFGQRALVGGLVIAATCSLISFFVIVRRLAFVGMGISHAAFGGVAIVIAAGINPILTAGGFCILVAGGIGWFSRKGRLHEDTVIGILFSAAMAMGVALVAVAHAYNLDLMSYLFWSILALSWVDVAIVAVLGALVISFLVLFFKELLFFVFDEETATASGVPVRLVYYGLLITMAVTIVVSIKLVGIILVSALLVIHGAIAQNLARQLKTMVWVSTGVAVGSAVWGLILSYAIDFPSGATIVLVLAMLYLLTSGLRHWLHHH